MKKLTPAHYVNQPISSSDVLRLDAFLDRNCPGWRDSLSLHEATYRRWVHCPSTERCARWYGEYVAVWDDATDFDGPDDLLRYCICDIEGDLTPLAVWRQG
ncbi:hypothetical protein [Anatilimnocola floriformis]|uniref:hypothetical protein n=1 Tax=Anatilimnocola floriformis TaxID=2948575 RepID=UPI0020C4BEC3|nr:hypothetical protein [Anatilimnocola floriformis]